MGEEINNVHRAIGVMGRKLDEQAERTRNLREQISQLATMPEAIAGLLVRVAALEQTMAKITEEDIIAAAALVAVERGHQLDELSGQLLYGAGVDDTAKHMANIQHAIADGVRKGVELAIRRNQQG